MRLLRPAHDRARQRHLPRRLTHVISGLELRNKIQKPQRELATLFWKFFQIFLPEEAMHLDLLARDAVRLDVVERNAVVDLERDPPVDAALAVVDEEHAEDAARVAEDEVVQQTLDCRVRVEIVFGVVS